MIGCPVAAACLLACCDGELSQQPIWPQLAHLRRWNHQPPAALHSTQPGPLGGTLGSICASAVMPRLLACVVWPASLSGPLRCLVPLGGELDHAADVLPAGQVGIP